MCVWVMTIARLGLKVVVRCQCPACVGMVTKLVCLTSILDQCNIIIIPFVDPWFVYGHERQHPHATKNSSIFFALLSLLASYVKLHHRHSMGSQQCIIIIILLRRRGSTRYSPNIQNKTQSIKTSKQYTKEKPNLDINRLSKNIP